MSAFGVVFAHGKIHGPTPVDERGLGGSTENKIPFMVVPGPKSPYFDKLDFEMDGARGVKDEMGFWYVCLPSLAHANVLIDMFKSGQFK